MAENRPSSPKEEEQPTPKKLKMSTTTSGDEDIDAAKTTSLGSPKKRRYKQRKVAIFFAYCGVGYQGMQKNPGAKTIEGDLEEALYHAGAVPEHDRGMPRRFDWARSARTDKGVSAVGQVVSGRFYVDPPGFVDRLNSNLASQIRIFGYKRVTPSFSAKKFCDRRRYVYLLPVFALDPSCHRDRESVLASLGSENELAKCFECSERGRKVEGVMGKRGFESKSQSDISSNNGAAIPNTEAKEVSNSNNEEDLPDSVQIIPSNDTDLPSECKTDLGNSSNNGAAVSVYNAESGISLSNNEEDLPDSVQIIPSNDTDLPSERETDLRNSSSNGCAILTMGFKESAIVAAADNDDSKLDSGEVSEHGVERMVTQEGESKGNPDGGCGDGVEKLERSKFRYGEEEKERFNRILKNYEGTHNFHNFTTRIKAEDPSAQRYIVSFDASTTLTIEGIEFVKCEVIGQSFMLHQIRKMIGLAVAIMRNFAPESLFPKVFERDFRIIVPMAPEVGLFLDECFFSSYNNKWTDHEELSMKDYAEEVEDFKVKNIYSHIANTEHKEGTVGLWLHSLNNRNYPEFCELDDGATAETKMVEVDNDS